MWHYRGYYGKTKAGHMKELSSGFIGWTEVRKASSKYATAELTLKDKEE